MYYLIALNPIITHMINTGSKKISDISKTLIHEYKLKTLTGIKTRKLPSSSIRYGWGINHPSQEIPAHGKSGKIHNLLNELFYKIYYL